MKKVSELSTLCGIEACAIVFSPYDAQPELWPSPIGVQRVLSQFKKMPEMEQSKKMVHFSDTLLFLFKIECPNTSCCPFPWHRWTRRRFCGRGSPRPMTNWRRWERTTGRKRWRGLCFKASPLPKAFMHSTCLTWTTSLGSLIKISKTLLNALTLSRSLRPTLSHTLTLTLTLSRLPRPRPPPGLWSLSALRTKWGSSGMTCSCPSEIKLIAIIMQCGQMPFSLSFL